MCTKYSPWQRINRLRDFAKYKKERRQARRHMGFVCELHHSQLQGGWFFLHEHPAQADSWEEPCIRRLLGKAEVRVVDMDQCQFGQQDSKGGPIRKPTKWMFNCIHILEELDKSCRSQGGVCSRTGTPHTVCSGKTARDAAI